MQFLWFCLCLVILWIMSLILNVVYLNLTLQWYRPAKSSRSAKTRHSVRYAFPCLHNYKWTSYAVLSQKKTSLSSIRNLNLVCCFCAETNLHGMIPRYTKPWCQDTALPVCLRSAAHIEPLAPVFRCPVVSGVRLILSLSVSARW